MNNLTNHNYIGSLQELCVKLKMIEANRLFVDHGATMCVNNRNLFKMEARVNYEGNEFSGIGEGFKKQEAKSISAKFCLIKFIAYLRANEHPQIRLQDYGLTDGDLILGTDPRMHTADDSGLNTSQSSSSSESGSKQPAEKSTKPSLSPNGNQTNDLMNSLSAIQAYVNNKETYRKEANPFAKRSSSKAASKAASKEAGKTNHSDDSSAATSNTPKPTTALYAKPPSLQQIPFRRTTGDRSPSIDLKFDSSMSLSGKDEDDGRCILQLNDFRTKSERSETEQLSETDQSEMDDLSRATTSSSSRSGRGDETLKGYNYLLDNHATIRGLYDNYDLEKGLSWFVLLDKLIEQLPELSTEFHQKASNNRKISYQKIYYGDWNLITVFSEMSAAESAENCSLKIFKRLLEFKAEALP